MEGLAHGRGRGAGRTEGKVMGNINKVSRKYNQRKKVRENDTCFYWRPGIGDNVVCSQNLCSNRTPRDVTYFIVQIFVCRHWN